MLKNLLLLCLVSFCISFCLSLLINRDIKIALIASLINLIATFLGAVVVNRQQRTLLKLPVNALQTQIHQFERRKQQLMQTLSATAAEIHRTEANLGFLKAELSQMYTQSVEQRSYQQQLHQDLIQLQEHKSLLEAELQDLQSQIQNLKQNREKMYKSLRYSKTEQNQEEGANRLSVQLQQMQAEIAKRQNQKQGLERNLALLNELTPQLEEKIQSLQIQIRGLENRKAELNQSLTSLTTTIQRTEVNLISWQKEFSHIQQQVAEQQKVKETLAAELVSLNQQRLEIVTAVETKKTLPDEWQEFARRLPEYELQILKALIEPGNPSTKIKKIAEENITMPELLIDLLNNRAFNILGDLIVEPGLGTSVPKIPEEYLTKVEQVVNVLPLVSRGSCVDFVKIQSNELSYMAKPKIPKRISTTLINSLSTGVVPRVGLEYIAVGREQEIATLLQDLEDIAEGSARFRFVVGRYGSGKSFLLQLMCNYAVERSFVVAGAELSAERRLVGADGQGIATYRELMRNIATKTHPHGGALALILERWISSIQTQVVQATGVLPQDTGFDDYVESEILAAIKQIEGLVHEFAFATVVTTYWRGYRLDDDAKKSAALRWLRGEFATKTEVDSALGVQDIIDDNNWYNYIKLFAKFVSDIGYKGFLVVLDEASHLHKDQAKSVTASANQGENVDRVSRQNNYDKLLAMFNDTMQGRTKYLGIYVGGTSEFLEDLESGLSTNRDWQRRTAKSRSTQGLLDSSKLVIQLEALRIPEILLLLQRIANVHAIHFDYESFVTNSELHEFVQEIETSLGAEASFMPTEIVQNFVRILSILQQSPKNSFSELLHSIDFSLAP